MKSSVPDDVFGKVSAYDLEREASDYALCNGICMCTKTNSDDIVAIAPMTVFPSPFPRSCFILAKEVQKDVNLLMHKVSYDQKFLTSSLESTIAVDEFTRNLFDVYEKVLKRGTAQQNSFGLFRADYMVDETQSEPRLRQVEVNAIASSFVGLAPKVTNLHRHIVSVFGNKRDLDRLPRNESDVNYARAFIEAWESYGQSSAVILVVKEDRTINICDQRSVQFAINVLRPDIRIIRRSFAELCSSTVLRDNQLLFVDNSEVALVYYRYGYDPNHYQGQKDWDLRLLIETSRAIKCPSINYHLAGVKKVQQILSDRSVLENFLEPNRAEKVYETFAGLWGFDLTECGNKTVQLALSNPELYVMKPQREGGGNNIYGKDIPAELNPIKDSRLREAYILMELIKPPILANLLIGPNIHINAEQPFQQIVSELGIYGAIYGNESGVHFNEECGHVLRSKFSGVNEGGIAAGFGAIDSPFLY